MTSLGIMADNDVLFAGTDRVVRPSRMQTDDTVAAYDFYTWLDSSDNGHNLIRGPGVMLHENGALQLRTGATAYAICDGVVPGSQFSVVISVVTAGTAGTLFGNYASADEGLRIWTDTSPKLLARIGSTTGQISLTLPATLNVPIDFAYSYNAGAQLLCTEKQSITGNDTSPLGSNPFRIGASILSTPTASNALYTSTTIYYGAHSLADIRTLIGLARQKRIQDGFGL